MSCTCTVVLSEVIKIAREHSRDCAQLNRTVIVQRGCRVEHKNVATITYLENATNYKQDVMYVHVDMSASIGVSHQYKQQHVDIVGAC